MAVGLATAHAAWPAACSDASGPADDPGVALEQARARWEASGVTGYRMTLARVCECPAPTAAVVVVREGRVAGVSDVETGEPLAPEVAAFFLSVDEIFDALAAGIAEGARVEATYDPVLGYPVHVLVDPVSSAIDDEVAYDISDLEPGAGAEVQAALDDGIRTWSAAGFSSYDLDVRRLCDCDPGLTGTVKVRVRSGQVVARTLAPKGEELALEFAEAYPTITGLFAVVQDALDRGADAIQVEFEPDLGFPEDLAIDYREGRVTDDLAFEVVKLVPVDLEEEP